MSTYSTVVSGGTSGTWSNCRNIHLTVDLKHKHLAGHCPVEGSASTNRASKRMTHRAQLRGRLGERIFHGSSCAERTRPTARYPRNE
ncbi:hypothetical protein TNCT_328531 [Trichonephila clavata]|uniref:Uncharacterized protein n=1 Tax=Trichonephila clavata TaxID=2740835 RepID=A0A8X6IS81_TRICU|nr:hypothetical protein TNCT_328531 [Trichonephila clavata]